jgi:hypothetical protein
MSGALLYAHELAAIQIELRTLHVSVGEFQQSVPQGLELRECVERVRGEIVLLVDPL